MSQSTESEEHSTRYAASAAMTVTAFAAFTGAMTWAARRRGPWYDEFYTQYVSRPGRGWLDALTASWLPDNHPPFFYLLMRATAWFGEIETHRLVNLGVAAVALVGGWVVARSEPRLKTAATLAILLLAANPWTMNTATELRSYFVSLCAGALLCLTLAAIWIAPSRARSGRGIVYAVTTLVSFNTHIVTSVISAALIAPFLAVALARRDRARLHALLPAPLFAVLLFLCVTAFQLPYWSRNTHVFWIPTGLNGAWLAIYYATLRTLEANPLIVLGSVIGIVLLGRDQLRADGRPHLPAPCVLAGTGIALAFGLLACLHVIRPIIVEKYLVAAVGALTCVLALACARTLAAFPRRVETVLLAMALAASGAALAHNAARVAHRHSWLGTGSLIARTVTNCPGTTVHTDPFWNADVIAMPPADNGRVLPWAYGVIAARLGFSVAPVSSLHLSSVCPNLFWAEHQAAQKFDAATILAHIRQRGFAVGSIILYRVGDGWVASDRPLTH